MDFRKEEGRAEAFRGTTRFLRAAERIFAAAEEPVEVLDSQFNVLAVNDAHVRFTGYAPSECIGLRSVVLTAIAAQRKLSRAVGRELERSGTWQGEIVIGHTSNGPLRLRLLLKELHDGTRQECMYLAVFSGIALQPVIRERLRAGRGGQGAPPLTRVVGVILRQP